MFDASSIALPCLLGAALVLGGCAIAPNSFRIESAENLHDRMLVPPGTVISEDKLTLHVQTQNLQCQKALPTRHGWVTVSNPYWHEVGSRVVRIEVDRSLPFGELTLPPPAACLNVAVRPADPCLQDWIVHNVWRVIETETDWKKCLSDMTKFVADVAQVLPHRVSESGALREERTYARMPERAWRSAPLDAEVISLLPGATVCVNRDHTLSTPNPMTWVSSGQSCARLLEASEGRGSVVLSRTDTEYTFPIAREFYAKDEAVIYEARSWLAVRGALATLMPQGAFLYLYYSGKHNVPEEGHWASNESGSLRFYPNGKIEPPIPISPILIAHSQPLVLTRAAVVDLLALCVADKVDGKRVERRCFAFRDFASIDVLRPFSVDGRIHYAPSGTLTTDIPEIAASRRPVATRVFRGRTVPMDFDVSNARNAVPLAAGDQFGGQR